MGSKWTGAWATSALMTETLQGLCVGPEADAQVGSVLWFGRGDHAFK